MKSAGRRVRKPKGFLLASTTGGNDLRSMMRVLIGVVCALGGVVPVMLWSQWDFPDDPPEALALLPLIVGAAAGLLGQFVIAPRVIPQPPSHFLEFLGDRLTIYCQDGSILEVANAKLDVERPPSSRFPTALRAKGRRYSLAAAYVAIDSARMQAHRESGQGVKFRCPLIELREDKGVLRAVRIEATGRYSSREKPI